MLHFKKEKELKSILFLIIKLNTAGGAERSLLWFLEWKGHERTYGFLTALPKALCGMRRVIQSSINKALFYMLKASNPESLCNK